MPPVSKTSLSKRVCSGNPITMTCGPMTFLGVAHQLFDFSSRSQMADQLELYSWGFLTTFAPADIDTRLGSESTGAFSEPAAAVASTVGDGFALFVSTFVAGAGWLF